MMRRAGGGSSGPDFPPGGSFVYAVLQNRRAAALGRLWRHLGPRHVASPRLDGLMQLERTGPFIPPITLPGIGDVVVTDGFRAALERAGFAGLSFAPVIKARIVEYHWELWDRTATSPVELPESGEPEAYILARPHSPVVAEQFGPLWEVTLPEGARWMASGSAEGSTNTESIQRRGAGAPVRPTGKRHVMATEVGKQQLEETAAEWLDFQEVLH